MMTTNSQPANINRTCYRKNEDQWRNLPGCRAIRSQTTALVAALLPSSYPREQILPHFVLIFSFVHDLVSNLSDHFSCGWVRVKCFLKFIFFVEAVIRSKGFVSNLTSFLEASVEQLTSWSVFLNSIPERKKLAQFFLFFVSTRSHFFLVFVSNCALEDFSSLNFVLNESWLFHFWETYLTLAFS